MTAQIIQLRDYQNPKDVARMYGETTLEQQACGLVDYINNLTAPTAMQPLEREFANVLYNHLPELYITETALFGGAGIDGMYEAPLKDPA